MIRLFTLKEILNGKTPTINILDVGAMVEGEERYTSLLDCHLAKITAVEPNPNQMKKVQRERPNTYRFLSEFLGDGNSATVFIAQYPGCTSLLKPNPEILNKFVQMGTEPGANFFTKQKLNVGTKKLDDVKPMVDADYIKIDIQGSELAVLQNGTDTLEKAVVLEPEVEFLEVYKDQPLFGDIQLFLRDHGFVLHKLIDINSRCFRPIIYQDNEYAGMSQFMWADAIFVRDFSNLENYSDDMLLKTALIMNDVYASYDFVHLLLSEFDRRNKTTYTIKYVERLMTFPERPRFLANLNEYV